MIEEMEILIFQYISAYFYLNFIFPQYFTKDDIISLQVRIYFNSSGMSYASDFFMIFIFTGGITENFVRSSVQIFFANFTFSSHKLLYINPCHLSVLNR